jgi:hypothetical protein
MLVRPKHLEWNFKKRGKLKKEVEQSVQKGELSKNDANYLLSHDRFRPFIDKVDSHCFFCGDKLKIPAVMWHGVNGTKTDSLEVWFHPGCVEGFAQCLIRDSNEAEFGKEAADAILKVWKIKYGRSGR